MKNICKKIASSIFAFSALLSGVSSCSRGESPVVYIPGWDFFYRLMLRTDPIDLIAWEVEDSWDTTIISFKYGSGGVFPEEIWYRQEHLNCPAEIMREILRFRPDNLDTYIYIVDCPARIWRTFDDHLQIYDEEEYSHKYRELRKALGLD